ncbi:hypothetical protein G6F47_013592 [Rhizopus delemar]|nr:hypothetical protein G6F47_013592 [Rhizopus delemar]
MNSMRPSTLLWTSQLDLVPQDQSNGKGSGPLNCKPWLIVATGSTVKAHVRFRTAVKRAKRESWRAFCDSLARGDFSAAVRRVKQVHNRRRPQVSYAHPDGPVAGANAMRDHLASVYSGSGLPSSRPPPLPSPDGQFWSWLWFWSRLWSWS